MPPSRTLEQKLKFDSGLTIGHHGVWFRKEGQTRRAVVTIPKAGKVRILLKIGQHLTQFVVVGDSMKSEGMITRPVEIEEFEQSTMDPVVSIHV